MLAPYGQREHVSTSMPDYKVDLVRTTLPKPAHAAAFLDLLTLTIGEAEKKAAKPKTKVVTGNFISR